MQVRQGAVGREEEHAPGLMRIDGVKDGGAQLHWLPPLILRNADDTPTAE